MKGHRKRTDGQTEGRMDGRTGEQNVYEWGRVNCSVIEDGWTKGKTDLENDGRTE